MRILITGGCGFLGSNLALHGMNLGHEIIIVDNLYRDGSENNLRWLKENGKFNFYNVDIADYESLKAVFKEIIPEVVRVIQELRHQNARKLFFPKECPECQSKLVKESVEAATRCINNSCPAILRGALKHWVSKEAMDIESGWEQAKPNGIGIDKDWQDRRESVRHSTTRSALTA